MEKWKEVFGYDILYEVSDEGRVRTRYSRTSGYTEEYREVRPTDNGNGYLRFNWKTNGVQKTVYLHKLVASAFLENKRNLSEVNHKNENKYDNRAENLEWCTHKENCMYGTRNIRTACKKRIAVRNVETGEIYNSAKEAALENGVCVTAISNCLNGRSETSGGYHWEYANV
jgi:hypothetical protein